MKNKPKDKERPGEFSRRRGSGEGIQTGRQTLTEQFKPSS